MKTTEKMAQLSDKRYRHIIKKIIMPKINKASKKGLREIMITKTDVSPAYYKAIEAIMKPQGYTFTDQTEHFDYYSSVMYYYKDREHENESIDAVKISW